MKAMAQFTGDDAWQRRNVEAANEKVGKGQRQRIEICLRALWEMETDATLKAAYAEGLRHSAELTSQSLNLIEKFDVNGTEVFNVDWHVMNGAWRRQTNEQDAVEVANAGLRLQLKASPRLHIEKDYLREPGFAAWVVTLCPDRDLIATHRAAIERVITHCDFRRVYLSQFFPLESAWWRMKLLEK